MKNNEKAPQVSVVVPHYNDVSTLGAALDSALHQSVGDIEVILVDDCSSEDTSLVVGRFDDPRLRVIRHDFNRGPAAARNTGIAAARGEFIAFLDADDIWYPSKLEHQLAALGHDAAANSASCCAYLLL